VKHTVIVTGVGGGRIARAPLLFARPLFPCVTVVAPARGSGAIAAGLPTHPGQCDLAFAMVALMLRRATIAAVARSIGRYPPCNKT
jgi:hypothetical protein